MKISCSVNRSHGEDPLRGFRGGEKKGRKLAVLLGVEVHFAVLKRLAQQACHPINYLP